MGDRYEDTARELAEAAKRASQEEGAFWTTSDSPAAEAIDSPIGPLARLIAAHSPDVVRALAEVVARLRERVAEGHGQGYDGKEWRWCPAVLDDHCICGHDEDADALARLDAATGGGR